ncbi:hypothetical protein AKJ65_00465 [candidate division MSBL1 archaeon SCGC-AAA259E19]|uniref:Uncharacterized protein n=2 Tax=candidate division MSBL1 TaxID=215777 RepID=A0A133V5Q1_9EURY|nr:hypothetical protein AKJ65_00465 [candidate division MSBL1 archaeon SCGC-AAA259E19]KXB01771.1 hypothetical protein AKJ41_00300 [candidate division MSBL1 archaeon SCGC-AAA259O05]
MASEKINNLLTPSLDEDCTLFEGSKIEGLRKVSGEDIVEVSPCASERGKLMAEIDLSEAREDQFLEMSTLGLLLDSYKEHFTEMKFGSKLGVARIMWKAHRIYVYQTGKFKIRFAHSREDAIRTLNSLLGLIQGSIFCKKCGNPTIDCILGKCDVCTESASPQVISIEDYFNGPLLLRGYESLKEVLKNSRKLRQELSREKKAWPATLENSMKRKLKEAIEYGIDFSLESQTFKNSYIGVEMISIAKENLFLLDQERTLMETLDSSLSKEAEEIIHRMNEIPWELNENLLKVTFEEGKMEEGILEEKISEFEAGLKEVERGSVSISKNVLDGLQKLIQTQANFLRKINAERDIG